MEPEIPSLPVMETFYTIQGEGMHSGTAAYFIRLGGCDVGCTWCDVKESWDAHKHPLIPVSQIAAEAASSGAKLVVVTGGEPAMHPLQELTSSLHILGLLTHIETSGVHPLTGEWDWVTFSPKKFKSPHPEIYEKARELKVVVNHLSDIEWATTHAQKVRAGCALFLQPEWEKRDRMVPAILGYIRKNPQWRISLQTHKYIGVD